MKNKSEYQLILKLNTYQESVLTQDEVYKACSGMANVGHYHAAELDLQYYQKELLFIRRLIYQGELEKAQLNLLSLQDTNLPELYLGDIQALLGIVLRAKGQCELARQKFINSTFHFGKINELHRINRSLINASVCENGLNSYSGGVLYALEQNAQREKFYDLVGLIKRGRARELMLQNNFIQADLELKSAIYNYELDGPPDDLAVTKIMSAIVNIANGNLVEAQNLYKSVSIVDGKVKNYINIFKSIYRGEVPIVPEGHAFAGIEWSLLINNFSLTGKIIQTLQHKGPQNRDQLIYHLWGADATDVSYCNRLFVALAKIKKIGTHQIKFDGEKYRLLV